METFTTAFDSQSVPWNQNSRNWQEAENINNPTSSKTNKADTFPK